MIAVLLIIVSSLCLWRAFVHAWQMNGNATFEQRLLNAVISAASAGVLWLACASIFQRPG